MAISSASASEGALRSLILGESGWIDCAEGCSGAEAAGARAATGNELRMIRRTVKKGINFDDTRCDVRSTDYSFIRNSYESMMRSVENIPEDKKSTMATVHSSLQTGLIILKDQKPNISENKQSISESLPDRLKINITKIHMALLD